MSKPVLAFAIAATLVPLSARASSIEFAGIGKAQVVTVAGVRNVTAWAGELEWEWSSGAPAGSPDDFYSYCVDLLNNERNLQTVTVRSTDLMSTVADHGAQKAAWLFDTFAASVHGSSGTAAMGAGLQLAIWEVLYDNTFSLSDGSFYVTSASFGALSAAQTYLGALTTAGSDYLSASTTWLDAPAPYGQDQITAAPVPEPASLLLLGTGLAGVAARTRRRKQIS